MLDRDTIDRLWDDANEATTPGEFMGYAFARVIAALAYEDAAKVCEKISRGYDSDFAPNHSGGAFVCAAAIRERAKEMKK